MAIKSNDTTGTIILPTGTTPAAAGEIGFDGTNVSVYQGGAKTNIETHVNKGSASGYCGLDSGSKVAIGNVPTGSSSSTVTIGNDTRLNPVPSGAGKMVYDTGAAYAAAAAGTSSQVLRGGTAPSFGTVTEAMQSLSDNTTCNLSISAHGYTPKAPNNTSQFLRGDATWAALPSKSYLIGSSTGSSTITIPQNAVSTTGECIVIYGSNTQNTSGYVTVGGAGIYYYSAAGGTATIFVGTLCLRWTGSGTTWNALTLSTSNGTYYSWATYSSSVSFGNPTTGSITVTPNANSYMTFVSVMKL